MRSAAVLLASEQQLVVVDLSSCEMLIEQAAVAVKLWAVFIALHHVLCFTDLQASCLLVDELLTSAF